MRRMFPWLLAACVFAGCATAVLHEDRPVMIAASRPVPPAPEPEPRVEVEETRIRVDEKIHFEFDSAEISAVSDGLLAEIARVITEHPEIARIRVEGHTDNEGAARYNQELSERRAQSVVDRLVALGVAAERLDPQGFGLTQPIADNGSDEGRAQNRRVEFDIVERAPEDATASAPTAGDEATAGGEVEAEAEETEAEPVAQAEQAEAAEEEEESAEPHAAATTETGPEKMMERTNFGGTR